MPEAFFKAVVKEGFRPKTVSHSENESLRATFDLPRKWPPRWGKGGVDSVLVLFNDHVHRLTARGSVLTDVRRKTLFITLSETMPSLKKTAEYLRSKGAVNQK